MTEDQARELIGQRRIANISGSPTVVEVDRVRYSLVFGRDRDDLTVGVVVKTLGAGPTIRAEYPLGYWETLLPFAGETELESESK